MIEIINTIQEYKDSTGNEKNLFSGTLYYVIEDKSGHFITNNIEGYLKKHDMYEIEKTEPDTPDEPITPEPIDPIPYDKVYTEDELYAKRDALKRILNTSWIDRDAELEARNQLRDINKSIKEYNTLKTEKDRLIQRIPGDVIKDANRYVKVRGEQEDWDLINKTKGYIGYVKKVLNNYSTTYFIDSMINYNKCRCRCR